jgi:hypothetical protein
VSGPLIFWVTVLLKDIKSQVITYLLVLNAICCLFMYFWFTGDALIGIHQHLSISMTIMTKLQGQVKCIYYLFLFFLFLLIETGPSPRRWDAPRFLPVSVRPSYRRAGRVQDSPGADLGSGKVSHCPGLRPRSLQGDA